MRNRYEIHYRCGHPDNCSICRRWGGHCTTMATEPATARKKALALSCGTGLSAVWVHDRETNQRKDFPLAPATVVLTAKAPTTGAPMEATFQVVSLSAHYATLYDPSSPPGAWQRYRLRDGCKAGDHLSAMLSYMWRIPEQTLVALRQVAHPPISL